MIVPAIALLGEAPVSHLGRGFFFDPTFPVVRRAGFFLLPVSGRALASVNRYDGRFEGSSIALPPVRRRSDEGLALGTSDRPPRRSGQRYGNRYHHCCSRPARRLVGAWPSSTRSAPQRGAFSVTPVHTGPQGFTSTRRSSKRERCLRSGAVPALSQHRTIFEKRSFACRASTLNNFTSSAMNTGSWERGLCPGGWN